MQSEKQNHSEWKNWYCCNGKVASTPSFKLAACKNGEHTPCSLHHCMFAPLTYGRYYSRTSVVINCALIQRRAYREDATTSPFYNEPHRSHVLFVKSAPDMTFTASQPGQSIILLRSENPIGKCAKLQAVAASNNRDHPTRSHYYIAYLRHWHIWVLFLAHLPLVVNCTFSVTSTERLQQYDFIQYISSTFVKFLEVKCSCN